MLKKRSNCLHGPQSLMPSQERHRYIDITRLKHKVLENVLTKFSAIARARAALNWVDRDTKVSKARIMAIAVFSLVLERKYLSCLWGGFQGSARDPSI